MHRFLAAALASIVASSALAQPEPTRAPPQPSWVEGALKFVPAGFVAGYVIRADETTGILPIFPANADDPNTPGSAFDRGQVMVVQLRRSGEAIEAVSASVRSREPSDIDAPHDTTADHMKQFEDTNRALADKAATLPAGTVPCDFGAYSIDRDPKGLNVRAEPSVKARVLGTLPPPFKVRRSDADEPDDGYRTEFTIIGFKDGWFLIEGATPPGKRYEREGRPLKYPKVLHRARLGRGQQGRRQFRQRRHPRRRAVPGPARRRALDPRHRPPRQRDRARQQPRPHPQLQRTVGAGGKERRARLVAAPVLEPGDELQLVDCGRAFPSLRHSVRCPRAAR